MRRDRGPPRARGGPAGPGAGRGRGEGPNRDRRKEADRLATAKFLMRQGGYFSGICARVTQLMVLCGLFFYFYFLWVTGKTGFPGVHMNALSVLHQIIMIPHIVAQEIIHVRTT